VIREAGCTTLEVRKTNIHKHQHSIKDLQDQFQMENNHVVEDIVKGNALELTDEVHQHQNGVTNGNYGECSSLPIPSETDLEPSPKKQGLENLGQVIVEKADAEKNDASESNSDINIEELIHSLVNEDLVNRAIQSDLAESEFDENANPPAANLENEITHDMTTTTEEEELEKECSKTDDVITDDDVQDKNELSDETPIQDEQVEVVVDKEPVCDAEEITKRDDVITEVESNAEFLEQPKSIDVADCIDSMVSEAVIEAALKDTDTMKDVSTEEEPILEQHIATIEEKENDEEASISDIQTDKLDVSAAASNVESNLENVMSAELPVQIQEQEVKIVENDTESEENTDNAAVSEILEQNSADINEPAEDKVENSEENALNELHTSATEEEKHIENTQSENTQIETNMDKAVIQSSENKEQNEVIIDNNDNSKEKVSNQEEELNNEIKENTMSNKEEPMNVDIVTDVNNEKENESNKVEVEETVPTEAEYTHSAEAEDQTKISVDMATLDDDKQSNEAETEIANNTQLFSEAVQNEDFDIPKQEKLDSLETSSVEECPKNIVLPAQNEDDNANLISASTEFVEIKPESQEKFEEDVQICETQKEINLDKEVGVSEESPETVVVTEEVEKVLEPAPEVSKVSEEVPEAEITVVPEVVEEKIEVETSENIAENTEKLIDEEETSISYADDQLDVEKVLPEPVVEVSKEVSETAVAPEEVENKEVEISENVTEKFIEEDTTSNSMADQPPEVDDLEVKVSQEVPEVVPEKDSIDPNDEIIHSKLETSKEVPSLETKVVVGVAEEKGTREQPNWLSRCRQKLDAELESTSAIPISMVAHMVNKPYSLLDETGADQKVNEISTQKLVIGVTANEEDLISNPCTMVTSTENSTTIISVTTTTSTSSTTKVSESTEAASTEEVTVVSATNSSNSLEEKFVSRVDIGMRDDGDQVQKNSEEEEKEISTEAKDEAPIPPARTKKSESLTSTEPKIEVKQSTTAVETAEEVPKTPILHQPSVQPEPPSGIMGYIRSFFSCMASKK